MNSLNPKHGTAIHSSDTLDQRLLEFVQKYPDLIVLTGAGCSTASGLGDYRDKSGQWKRPQPITGQVFINNAQARQRYWVRSFVGWPAFNQAMPSLAHIELKKLENLGHISQLVTQNVDNLHQKAGQLDVINLHGSLAGVECISCLKTIQREEFQKLLAEHNPWLVELNANYAPDGDADIELSQFDNVDIPCCEHCGGILKPTVVFFGENVPKQKVQNAMNSLKSSDGLLIVGSSLMVYSGFRFCREAHKNKIPIAIINDGVTRADDLASLRVNGDCGDRLYKLTTCL